VELQYASEGRVQLDDQEQRARHRECHSCLGVAASKSRMLFEVDDGIGARYVGALHWEFGRSLDPRRFVLPAMSGWDMASYAGDVRH
jgi:hypothetical protein